MHSTPSQKEFGKFLRSIRLERQLSLRDLAERVDLHHGYLGFIENGQRGIPRPKLMARLGVALDVSQDVLEWAAKGKRFLPWQKVLGASQENSVLFISLVLLDGAPSPSEIGELTQKLQDLVPGGEIILRIRPNKPLEGGVLVDLSPSKKEKKPE